MALPQSDVDNIATAGWKRVLDATEGGGVSIPAESAAGRLAAIRRSTHGAKADRDTILLKLDNLAAQVENLRRIVVMAHPEIITNGEQEPS